MTFSKKNANRLQKRPHRKHDLTCSPFYRLERRKDLALLLKLKPEQLSTLIQQRENLYLIKLEEINGKERVLHVPLASMRRVHDRLFQLLQRMRLPEFIRSPRTKSTCWGNASLHSDSKFLTAFDIQGFYPSTTEEHIFRFFKYRLEMSDDCARCLALLATYEGFLPLGSPASPHLACLTHLDLFEDAHASATLSGSKLSVWVDDVALSGPSHRRDILAQIRLKAEAKGLKLHKFRRGGGSRGVELTGTYIKNSGYSVANSSHLKVQKLTEELGVTSDPGDRYRLLNRLSAMARYQRTVLKSGGQSFVRIDGRLNFYKREMRALAKILSVTKPTTKVKTDIANLTDQPPFDLN